MCDHQTAECIESTGGIDSGRFVEKYECVCGATGMITGDAAAPADEWDHSGEIFS